MRVITGIAKGKRLKPLDSIEVRPTTDRVKEAVFSAIQFDVEGRVFLDLFAGSGQMGIEALSRGAKFAYFVDNSNDSVKICSENVKTSGFEKVSQVLRRDADAFLSSVNEKFDIAFLDPPYKTDLLISSALKVTEKMKDSGIIICEHPLEETMPKELNDFTLHRNYRYGKICISIYKKEN